MMSAILVSFNYDLLLCNHWTKSLMTDSIIPGFLPGNKRLVSSAKLRFVDHMKKKKQRT